MLNVEAIFAEPDVIVWKPDAKSNSPQRDRSETATSVDSEAVGDWRPSNATLAISSEVCEAVQAAELQPCINCGSAIFWRTPTGAASCAGCHPRPTDARKGLIVTIDGRNEWADYETEAEIVRRRRDTIWLL